MQWSHIKTLFILSFLVLNIYLLFQFVQRQDQYDLPSLSSDDPTLDEELESENIQIDDAILNREVPDLSYLSVAQRLFKSSEVEELNSIDGVEATMSLDKTLLFAQFEEPIEMPEEGAEREMLQSIVAPYVIQAGQYTYGTWNKDLNIIAFFQTKEGAPLFLNQQAILLLYLNDDNEITHYTQTMLGDHEKQGDRSIVSPKTAIGYLLRSNNSSYLRQDQEVSEIDIGYYSRIDPEDGGEIVFAPTWKVTIEDTVDYFVNGFEGIIYPGDYTKFFTDTINENILVQARRLDEENEIRENIIQLMEGKLEEIGSEDE
ncbi:two-component system regulatory protein YycI [Oceanobacillus sp. 1P07AA]|uniref:two-component system regulatory protein YycI n=1 Tax=Oceanobacillus sp. 1P07AA TaxID=3132293 RepID=UPI0039A59173